MASSDRFRTDPEQELERDLESRPEPEPELALLNSLQSLSLLKDESLDVENSSLQG
jgi:hypothetical protein